MHIPEPAAELFGHLAYYFFEIQPDLPLFTHLIISALFPIYTGAHASLARPSSAAKPAKRARAPGEDVDEHEDDEDEEDADDVQRMEGLSLQDAIVMPIFAGVTLTGLYLLIKWLKDLALLNQILNAYFAFFAFGSVSRFLTDAMDFTHGVVFPRRFVSGEVLWDVNVRRRSACPKDVRTGETRNDIAAMSSPLPGFLSALPLPGAVRDALWMIRGLPKQKWTVKAYLHRIAAFRTRIGLHGILGLGLGTAAVLYFNFVDKPWFLTNLMGFAFSYIALQLMSPTTFATGSLLLSALFFYDIYMVFFTPMMVTVAKSLDIPIKLMFPRPDIPGATPDLPSIKQHAMLGLGDVVIPGIMIGLALRFDLYLFYLRKQKKQPVSDDSKTRLEIVKAPYLPVSRIWADKLWTRTSAASFPKPYFTASMVGYVFGMVVTLLVMRFMDHAQPALLYLVPGVLISLWSTALVRGELRDMWDFSEASDEEDDGDKKKATEGEGEEGEKKKAGPGQKSFFSEERQRKMEQRLENAMGKYVTADDCSSGAEEGSDDEAEGVSAHSPARPASRDKHRQTRDDREFFSFSITAPFPLNKRAESMDGKADSADTGAGARNGNAGVKVKKTTRKWAPVATGDFDGDGDQAGKRRRTS